MATVAAQGLDCRGAVEAQSPPSHVTGAELGGWRRVDNLHSRKLQAWGQRPGMDPVRGPVFVLFQP